MNFAPIALFVYNRVQHTRLTVEALAQNEYATKSDLFIYSDGPRSEADKEPVRKVREFVRRITGFKSVNVVEREQNLGLARSIINGVSDIVKRYGKIIVLEDDMITSPYFLKYMNEALDLYRDEERVISIHGYVYPAGRLPETFFLKGADCWGWATWARGWALFEPDGSKLYAELKHQRLEDYFDFHGTYPYARMLRDQIAGKNDSWAIRWYASALVHDKLTLYPGRSLVFNIGTDDSGTHCATTSNFVVSLAESPIVLDRIPVAENIAAFDQFASYFRSHKENPFRKFMNSLRRTFRK